MEEEGQKMSSKVAISGNLTYMRLQEAASPDATDSCLVLGQEFGCALLCPMVDSERYYR